MVAIPGNSIIREFEYKIAEYCGAKHCISVNNATIGILGVFYALGLGNSEIITTPLTWSGSFSGLQMLNCNIKFCDVEPENLTLNPDLIESLITPYTKAVFTADFLGYPARLDRIRKICTNHNLLLIHDAASSFGSKYNNLYSGYYADATILSFGAKKIFSIGEGGCILSENDEIFKKITKVIMHPIRQENERLECNPFALNTNINPFAAEFGVKIFDQKIIEIESSQKWIRDWLERNLSIVTCSSYEPNFYRVVVPAEYLAGTEWRYEISDIPFNSPIYKELNFWLPQAEENQLCPIAEDGINQFKILQIKMTL